MLDQLIRVQALTCSCVVLKYTSIPALRQELRDFVDCHCTYYINKTTTCVEVKVSKNKSLGVVYYNNDLQYWSR